ncbi:hypothetical protein tb265_06270 [Gemmatimonadetes bacterium T265]|nr:hypothetical protein tb265_06270 [Gemmatimonadetes bacterium T265]
MTSVLLPAARTAPSSPARAADPDAEGRGARALARAWQGAAAVPGRFPAEVRAVLAHHPAFAHVAALLVAPEGAARVVDGDDVGPGTAADALVVARAADGLAALAVVGTAGGFGPAGDVAHAHTARVADVLGVDALPDGIPYRLLQRTAAALCAAAAFAAPHAVVLVHAFGRRPVANGSPTPPDGFDEYAALIAWAGRVARSRGSAADGTTADAVIPGAVVPGALVTVGWAGGRRLHFGWAAGAPAPAALPSPDEQLRDQLGAILGGPVDHEGSALFAYGDPVEVLVRADAHAVHVEVPAVEWRGHTAVLTGERRASFPREGVTRLGGDAPFIEAVYTARAERVARFRTCAACGERTPPERMRGATLCTHCAAGR